MLIGAGGATVPGAPTSVSASFVSSTSASISFSAPASNGGSAILDYRVTSSPGGVTATGSGSPITITGLTTGQTYTFTVAARNAVGYSAESSASNSVALVVIAGPTNGVDYVIEQTYTRSDASSSTIRTVSNPAPGYTRTIEFYLAGGGGLQPPFFDYNGGTAGSGEVAKWTYTAAGDESSFALQQFNYTSQNGYLQLTVQGGSRNGQYLRVGSFPSNAGFGHGGAPDSQVSNSNLTGRTLNFNGAARMGSGNIGYNDGYNYGPGAQASYGNSSTNYTVGGVTLNMLGSTPPGGLTRGGTIMGRSGRPSENSPTWTDHPGGVIINWKNA